MASRLSIFSTKTLSALAGTCTALLTWCSRSKDCSVRPRVHPWKQSVVWQLMGPQAVCVTENSWRPDLVAGMRLSGPQGNSSQLLFPKGRLLTVEDHLSNIWVSASPTPASPSPTPLPILFFSCRAISTSLPDSTASSSPPPRSPHKLVQAYFFLRTRQRMPMMKLKQKQIQVRMKEQPW